MLCLIEIPRGMVQKESMLTENNQYFTLHYIIVFPFHAVTHSAFVRGNFSFFLTVFVGLMVIFLLKQGSHWKS